MVVRLTMMMRRGRWAIARRMVLSVLALATPVAAIGAPADATAAAPPGRITTLVTGARTDNTIRRAIAHSPRLIIIVSRLTTMSFAPRLNIR